MRARKRPSTNKVRNQYETDYDDKIIAMDEYWADDGEAPKWRQDMKIGRKIDLI